MENFRGIAWMTGSMAGFALEDAFIKTAARHMPTSQVLILVGLLGSLVFALWCLRRGERILTRDLFHPAVAIRNLGEIVGTLSFVSAMVLMPLALVSAITQAMPLVVTLGAVLAFGATVGWRRWLAIAVGFTGVLIVVRPGAEGFDPASLLAVLGTVALAVRDLATRKVPPTISSPQVATWGFFSCGLSGVLMLPFWGAPVWPALSDWLVLGGAVLFGVLGYYAITTAMRVGEIAVVTPFRYSRLLFAIILGFLVFGEVPDGATLAGAALILGSGLYTLARERAARRRPLSTIGSAG